MENILTGLNVLLSVDMSFLYVRTTTGALRTSVKMSIVTECLKLLGMIGPNISPNYLINLVGMLYDWNALLIPGFLISLRSLFLLVWSN